MEKLNAPASILRMLVAVFSASLFLCAPAGAQQDLPRQVQVDLAMEAITSAIRDNKPQAALDGIRKFRAIGVAIPPRLLFVETRLSLLAGDPVRAETALNDYLKTAPKTDPSYADAIKLFASTKAAADSARDARRTPEEKAAAALATRLADQNRIFAAAFARQPALTVFDSCTGCPAMVKLPAGSFTATRQFNPPLPAQSAVFTLPEFAMGAYEVTVRQWQLCVADGACRAITVSFQNEDDFPISNVTYDDANAYVRWLSQKTGMPYRLPSNIEWDYAAKKGGTTTKYYFGDALNNVCQYENVSTFARAKGGGVFGEPIRCGASYGYGRVEKVGSRKSNPFGLYDLYGNVRELVADCEQNLLSKFPQDGSPFLEKSCSKYLLRGGEYDATHERLLDLQNSVENRKDALSVRSSGFRVALSYR